MPSTTGRPISAADIEAARVLLGVGPAANRAEILRAWRATIRVTHPDTVDTTIQPDAERLSRTVNDARDLLLAVAPLPPPPWPPLASASRSDTEVAPARRPHTPRRVAFTLFVIGLVSVVLVLGLLALDATRRSATDRIKRPSDALETAEARSAPSYAVPVPTGDGISLPAPTPDSAVRLLLWAASTGVAEIADGLFEPGISPAALTEILRAVTAPGVGAPVLTTAAQTVYCDTRENIDVICRTQPEGFMPPLVVRQRGGDWRIAGVATP